MSTDVRLLVVRNIQVEVVRKNIKNLHLGVYPPNGRVRVAAPLILNDEAIRLAVIEKMAWIKRQKAQFEDQARQSQREMVNGESHYFLGRRYRLRLHEKDALPRVAIRGISVLDLFIRPASDVSQREKVLSRWYREQLRLIISDLVKKWQTILGVQVAEWGIKKMKTKWGSCNPRSRRAWFNLELAKVDEKCIEYIVVHELIHLKERRHNSKYMVHLEQHFPEWKSIRARLNKHPLGIL